MRRAFTWIQTKEMKASFFQQGNQIGPTQSHIGRMLHCGVGCVRDSRLECLIHSSDKGRRWLRESRVQRDKGRLGDLVCVL